ncbi:Ephrin type-B receptor 2 [Saguinus oedipus]|uniref:Ephrin type-B receptor 2 n=1 Tax=Saguinus oedipus TaxID=9490 RepID=A0ABQ9V9V1_SAGOE|nr:Ephrin type-B receptor 2 [Saguinus oedipus]
MKLRCPSGTFKANQGDEACTHCPINSRTTSEGATNCVCRNGYYRADLDPLDMPCTTAPEPPTDQPISPAPAIPSAPQAVISSVNETSLMLEWTPPRDSGGREDLVYNIICKSCGSGRGACTRCGDNVQYAPRQLGLTEPRIYISDLLAHTQYTFEIQAVNGVTDQSPFSPQFASVNITTNQAGKRFRRGSGERLSCRAGACPSVLTKDSHLWSDFFFERLLMGSVHP